jgi:hypothetical protein
MSIHGQLQMQKWQDESSLWDLELKCNKYIYNISQLVIHGWNVAHCCTMSVCNILILLQVWCRLPPPDIHNIWEIQEIGSHEWVGKRAFCKTFRCVTQQIFGDTDSPPFLPIPCFWQQNTLPASYLQQRWREWETRVGRVKDGIALLLGTWKIWDLCTAWIWVKMGLFKEVVAGQSEGWGTLPW